VKLGKRQPTIETGGRGKRKCSEVRRENFWGGTKRKRVYWKGTVHKKNTQKTTREFWALTKDGDSAKLTSQIKEVQIRKNYKRHQRVV